MAYNRSDSDSFAEYQMGEGFGSAVTGQKQTTNNIARIAEQNSNRLPAGLQGLAGYEPYADYLQEMEQSLTSGGNLGTKALSRLAQKNSYSIEGPDMNMAGAEGMSFGGIEDDAFAGTQDDAFAGYEGMGSAMISRTAKEAGIDDDDDDDDDAFDGYGGLGDTPLESFHTYFHKASKSNTETGLIKALAKAVAVVGDDTPMSVKQDYYNLATEMLKRRKKTNMRYLDLQRAEIESNIGWLINPSLPKTGGFGAMLNKAVGAVGAKLGMGEKAQIKAEKDMALGKKLLSNINKSQGLAGLGDFHGGGATKYIGFAAAGLAIVGVIWWYKNKQKVAAAAKRNKRRRKRK